MAQKLAINTMYPDEFLGWVQNQEQRFELVDGQPMMMGGANRTHNEIAGNTYVSLKSQLKGKPCKPYESDFAVKIPAGNIRYPDVSVDCGRADGKGKDLVSNTPVLVVEVLSNSTRTFDFLKKAKEYKTIASVEYILLIDQDAPYVIFQCCDDNRKWDEFHIIGIDSKIEMPAIGVTLQLCDLYEDVMFENILENIESSNFKP
ncbi:Uma2 family endonuclease [Propionivibrio sp.]|uniref:Uma2 family endonuclease n=1 Tax=Propionivibrio sp. TaxID=2212460 RepID=UPI003BF278E5